MVSPSGDAASRSLWTWSARVAQSIDDRTGSFGLSLRW
jgi:hypothetical protein